MRNIQLSIILAAAVLLPAAYSSENLHMGYIEFPPFYYTDKNGSSGGKMIDLAKSLAEKSGYSLSFKSYPARRLAKYIIDGDVGIFFGLSAFPGVSEGALISSMAVGFIHLKAFSFRQLPPINSKEDLVGKRILILRGYSYGSWINYINDPKNNVDAKVVDTHAQALRIIERRPAIDYLLDYEYPILNAAKQSGASQLYSSNLASFELRILVSKQLKNAEEIMADFEKAFNTLHPNGAEKHN